MALAHLENHGARAVLVFNTKGSRVALQWAKVCMVAYRGLYKILTKVSHSTESNSAYFYELQGPTFLDF